MLKNSLVMKYMVMKNISRQEAIDKLLDIREKCKNALETCNNMKVLGYLNAYTILEDNELDEDDLEDLL